MNRQKPPPWLRLFVCLGAVPMLAATGCRTDDEPLVEGLANPALRSTSLYVYVEKEQPTPVFLDDPGNACPECLASAEMVYQSDSQSILVTLVASIDVQVRWLEDDLGPGKTVGQQSSYTLPVGDELLTDASAAPKRIKMTVYGGSEDSPFRHHLYGCLAPQDGAIVTLNPADCSAAIASRPEVAPLVAKAVEALAAKKGAPVTLKLIGVHSDLETYDVEDGGSSGGGNGESTGGEDGE